MMDKYVCLVKGGIITIQESWYIEDGCYVEIVGDKITLFEIPYGGGEESKIGDYKTLEEAFNIIKTLN